MTDITEKMLVEIFKEGLLSKTKKEKTILDKSLLIIIGGIITVLTLATIKFIIAHY